jgi:hypothetical protein
MTTSRLPAGGLNDAVVSEAEAVLPAATHAGVEGSMAMGPLPASELLPLEEPEDDPPPEEPDADPLDDPELPSLWDPELLPVVGESSGGLLGPSVVLTSFEALSVLAS